VAQRAEDLDIPVLKPARPGDSDFVERLRGLDVDCCPVVAYGALLPSRALEVPRHGWVNLHFSLLPHWRGAAPVQRAIWAGDEVTGATTFRIVEELDAGPVYGAMTEPIRPTDTAADLFARVAEGGAHLLVDTLDGIEAGRLEARPQASDGVTYAGKVTVADARVAWDEPATAVDRRIRACTPAPGAWTTFGGERLKLGPVRPDPDQNPLPPGVLAVGRRAVHAGSGTHAVRLGQVRPVGKREMPAADWARGVRIDGGAAFE
jgi:methionyl-tRNA formyltransferase